MNANNAKDYLPLVQALVEGKVIQVVNIVDGGWSDMDQVNFTSPACEYRIKPEPREIWVNHYGNPCLFDQICHSKEEADCRVMSGSLLWQKRYREVIE